MTSTSTPALHARDLHKHFGAGAQTVHALRGVDLDIPAGTFTALMGPSGSGKSTLLQCIAGLERPDAGSVQIAGVDVTVAGEAARAVLRRRLVGLVFQQYHLLPFLTAAQNVALPLDLDGRGDPAAVLTALQRVQLDDRASHRPDQLSGGQQQRVAIARAVVTDPAVLLADEPTGALDRASSERVLDLLRGLVDADGRTVVMVTHDPVAASRADVVRYLVDGRLVGRAERPSLTDITATMAHLDELAATAQEDDR